MSMEEAMAMNVEPKTQKFLDALAAAGGPPIYTLTPDGARKVLSGAQAGPVKAPAVRYLGTIHDFVMLNGLSDTPAARSAIALANSMLRQALTK